MERILPIQEEMSKIVASGNYRTLSKENLARSVESLPFSFKKESENSYLKIRKHEYLAGLRQRRSKFDAAEKRYLARIECLERELHVLKCENDILKKSQDKKQRRGPLEKIEKWRKKNEFLDPKKCDFVANTFDFLNSSPLILKPQALSDAMLLRSTTLDGVTSVLGKQKFLKNLAFSKNSSFLDARVSYLLSQFNNIRHVFDSRKTIEDLRFAHVIVNGQNMLKKFSDIGIVYTNSQLNFKNAKIICAHVDGKFSNCPREFVQSFVLRLRVQRGKMVTIETFALALLKGKSQLFYEEFFRIIKANHCPHFPYLICDFELAISNAVRIVLPNVEIRGCYFHYQQNLHRKKRQIERWTAQKVSEQALRLLSLAPFLKRCSTYIEKLIKGIELDGENLFRHPDFKLASYVHRVYCGRLHGIFFQDLRRLIVRTNNSCEGFNSGLNKRLHQKGRVQDYAAFFEVTFKKDLVSPTRVKTELNGFDMFLLEVQKKSATNLRSIFEFCKTSPAIIGSNGSSLLRYLQEKPLTMTCNLALADDQAAKKRLDVLAGDYMRFTAQKRLEFQRFRRKDLHRIISNLDVENLKDLQSLETEIKVRVGRNEEESQSPTLFEFDIEENPDSFDLLQYPNERRTSQVPPDEDRPPLPHSIEGQGPSGAAPEGSFCFRPLRPRDQRPSSAEDNRDRIFDDEDTP